MRLIKPNLVCRIVELLKWTSLPPVILIPWDPGIMFTDGHVMIMQRANRPHFRKVCTRWIVNRSLTPINSVWSLIVAPSYQTITRSLTKADIEPCGNNFPCTGIYSKVCHPGQLQRTVDHRQSVLLCVTHLLRENYIH